LELHDFILHVYWLFIYGFDQRQRIYQKQKKSFLLHHSYDTLSGTLQDLIFFPSLQRQVWKSNKTHLVKLRSKVWKSSVSNNFLFK